MAVIRIGATKKYANNWSSAFGQKPSAKAGTEATKAAPAAKKKVPKKKSAAAKSK